MKKKNEFLEYIADCLSLFGPVTFRSMFGGYGVYKNGVIFAIIADDMLYLKAGKTNKKDFEKINSEPFTYETKKGKKAVMSYWLATGELLEEPEKLAEFANKSYEISLKK